MEEIRYNLRVKDVKRPTNPRYVNFYLLLLYIPIIRKVAVKLIRRYFRMPKSVNMTQGFYCSSSLLDVGENTGLGNLHIVAWTKVTIGKNCSFSFGNMIITSTHDYDDFHTVIGKPVIIGDNVWITSNVIILPGVRIGSNTVIGAGSVVTKDIPSGVFAAGNPCKVIKKIKFKIGDE